MISNAKPTIDWLLVGILTGVVLGVLAGWLFGEQVLFLSVLGELFLRALRLIVIPLIVATMITGVTSLGDVRKLGAIGISTVIYYLITTSVAVTLGLSMTNLFRPGDGIDISGAVTPEAVQGTEVSLKSVVLSLVPPNIFESMVNTDILPIIVCSLVFGGVLTTLGKQGQPVIEFFRGMNDAMMKIVHLIMWFAPIGVFALIASILGEKGGGDAVLAEMLQLLVFILTVVSGLLIHALVFIPLILFFVARRSPLQYAYGMLNALATAFSTSSSAATLPITMECVEDKNKIKPQTASFVLPLGATINMDGTAMYMGASVLFISQAYGVDLNLYQQIMIFLTTVLGSIGTAAIPSASLVLLVPILQSVNLPPDGISLIIAVDWLLDRCRTTVNIWGDSVGCAVIEKVTPLVASVAPDAIAKKEDVTPE